MPIQFDKFPLKLFRKGQALAWDPLAIDLARDREDWLKLNQPEREILLRTIVGFLIGERAVAHDLAPLQQALRKERGRMEEEMYLSEQTFEESVHVTFFQRWMDEVLPTELMSGRIPFPDASARGSILRDELPRAMQALLTDTSPRAQLHASVTYHIHVEGILAEFGYRFFYKALEGRNLLPGLVEGIRHIQRDEVRHIAFGIYFIQRLINEHPELEQAFIDEMEALRPASHASAMAFFDYYGGEMPFGLKAADFERFYDELYETRIRNVKKGELIEV